jgi:hypothetical protein
MFVSNLNQKMSQRFLVLVLLPHVRSDIRRNRRLHFALFQVGQGSLRSHVVSMQRARWRGRALIAAALGLRLKTGPSQLPACPPPAHPACLPDCSPPTLPACLQSLKKATYKAAAFYKGILLPLCSSGTCNLREAVILTSVIKRTSIPVLHSAAAMLRIAGGSLLPAAAAAAAADRKRVDDFCVAFECYCCCLTPLQFPYCSLRCCDVCWFLAEMPYSGTNSFFLRVLLDKKYALPYRVVDALVDHFMRFKTEERQLPVVWQQTLLCFVQR